MKIKLSYQDEGAERFILKLLQPILSCGSVKRSDRHPPYRHTYLTFDDDILCSISKNLIKPDI